MKKHIFTLLMLLVTASFMTADAQLVTGKRGSDDFQLGVAGFSYRKFNLEQTLKYLQSMDVHYFSVKDWWLPLNSTKEQMDAFKAKCAEYGINTRTERMTIAPAAKIPQIASVNTRPQSMRRLRFFFLCASS